MRCSKISRESESALISLLPTLFDMLNLLSIAAQTITKGGLILESFSFWLKSSKKGAHHNPEHYPPKEKILSVVIFFEI